MNSTHCITRIQAFSYRCPIPAPVETSFGRMLDRPGVFVRVEAEDGCFGWGEVFANWPAAGAEHRVNLIDRDLSQLVLGQVVGDPVRFFMSLSHKTHVRALQSGEWGPFRQCVAGIDIALWDMKARAAGLPLRKLLNANAPDEVPAYASGIHITQAEAEIARAREAGFNAFKVKVGFGHENEAQTLNALAGSLDEEETLFADANQGFDLDQARTFLAGIDDSGLGWMEEPIVADAPETDWQALAASTRIPLAGGENIAGLVEFKRAIDQGYLKYLQPDAAKWGGVSGCFEIGKAAVAAGRIYCPHFLGGGIGIAASAELLAAVGGPGLLEVDANPNPLRSAFDLAGVDRRSGKWQLSSDPGHGCASIPNEFESYLSHEIECSMR
ncbi:MAG: mandelate racemase/muconate lactonizing enzyme family protein [Rhizobiaceae bacterium]